MKIKCENCRGTGKNNNSRCAKCKGFRIYEIEPTEFLRLNRIRLSRKLPKLERV